MENVTTKKIFGRSVIIRKRKVKSRPISYRVTGCFRQFHAGKFSLYVSLPVPVKEVGFGKIDDRQ